MQRRIKEAGWLRGLPGWRVASLSSAPTQGERAATGLAPALSPPPPTACNGSTGRARVKGYAQSRAETTAEEEGQTKRAPEGGMEGNQEKNEWSGVQKKGGLTKTSMEEEEKKKKM